MEFNTIELSVSQSNPTDITNYSTGIYYYNNDVSGWFRYRGFVGRCDNGCFIIIAQFKGTNDKYALICDFRLTSTRSTGINLYFYNRDTSQVEYKSLAEIMSGMTF